MIRRGIWSHSIVFSNLLQDGDALWKNYGVLYDDTHRKWLAPAYDIVSTTIYLPRDVPALTLGGQKAWPGRRTIEAFGLHACGLRARDVRHCLEEVHHGMEAIVPAVDRLAPRDPKAIRLTEHLLALARS